jgi:Uma2 family endonuclease
MAVTTAPAQALDEPPAEGETGPRPFVWTRALYQRLGEVGILHEDDHVELIEGELIQMAAKKRPHVLAVAVASDTLRDVFRPSFHVQLQDPLGLGDRSEPEPDIAVIAGRARDYQDHPTTAALVVEVADSTLRYDRNRKGSLYARFGIQEFWIINLQERVLEVYREPADDRTARYGARYARQAIVGADGTVSPLAAPDQTVKVADLLP